MSSRASGKLLRKHTWKRWVLKQGAKLCQVAHQGSCCASTHGRGGCLSKGLNYVKSHIRETAAQAHAESLPRPKTYSWTAAFAPPGKSVTRISTCAREETRNQRRLTLGLLCARKEISRYQKNCCVFTPQAHGSLSTRTETCSCEKTVANSRCPIG